MRTGIKRQQLLVVIALLQFPVGTFAEQAHAYDLSGDIWGTHDPAIIKQDDTWYVFATGKAPGGGEIPIRCSHDLQHWELCGHVFDQIPEWIRQDSPGTKSLWAPDISRDAGEYACITRTHYLERTLPESHLPRTEPSMPRAPTTNGSIRGW